MLITIARMDDERSTSLGIDKLSEALQVAAPGGPI
jgi:hypothetical protein